MGEAEASLGWCTDEQASQSQLSQLKAQHPDPEGKWQGQVWSTVAVPQLWHINLREASSLAPGQRIPSLVLLALRHPQQDTVAHSGLSGWNLRYSEVGVTLVESWAMRSHSGSSRQAQSRFIWSRRMEAQSPLLSLRIQDKISATVATETFLGKEQIWG